MARAWWAAWRARGARGQHGARCARVLHAAGAAWRCVPRVCVARGWRTVPCSMHAKSVRWSAAHRSLPPSLSPPHAPRTRVGSAGCCRHGGRRAAFLL
eukprot:5944885-Prymnesium_polylepis.1